MTAFRRAETDYDAICKFREGARFRKMDLHTHTPASECSSFTLPPGIEDLLPPTGKLTKCRKFLQGLEAGKNPFQKACGSRDVASRPRLTPLPAPDAAVLSGIAAAWLKDMQDLLAHQEAMSKAEVERLEARRDACTKLAIRDVRNYLASHFFPEEFVMRCYIEGLQLVALTDHNHAGHIVPRMPQLGTWFQRLRAVNRAYLADIDKTGGKAVRDLLIKRLELAKRRLRATHKEVSFTDAEIASNHKDRPKKLKTAKQRFAHVEERRRYWLPSAGHPLIPLTLIPGTEITVSNVHVLALFPPRWYVPGRIGAILRNIGIPEDQWGRGFFAHATASVQDTITYVDEAGGIAVPAHANSDFKGILRLFERGLALYKVLEHPALLALESIGGSVLKAKKGKRGKNACETLHLLHTQSIRPAHAKALTFTKGSDAHECRIELDGTGEDLGMRCTYVKMDIRPDDTPEEIFRSLRMALLCGQSRIIEWPTEVGYNYLAREGEDYRVKAREREQLVDAAAMRPTILGLTVAGTGSYADGLAIRFNPYLNCIVGSGGKSTVIRLLTYAFGVCGFMSSTSDRWLPELVRVFWSDGGEVHCVERQGKSADPNDPKVAIRWLQRSSTGKWQSTGKKRETLIAELAKLVDIWPPVSVLTKKASLDAFEANVIADLTAHLRIGQIRGAKPLLINQPREIFCTHALFNEVLSRPHLKGRQIIWSTGSANVPTALDAEKIIVTRELDQGKRMEVQYGGDLHEDEIRGLFLDQLEGGWPAFARRNAIYMS